MPFYANICGDLRLNVDTLQHFKMCRNVHIIPDVRQSGYINSSVENIYMCELLIKWNSLQTRSYLLFLCGKLLKHVDQFIYLGSNISSAESNVYIRQAKLCNTIVRLSIWKFDFSDNIKLDFFQAVTVSVQLFGCTHWTVTKRMAKS